MSGNGFGCDFVFFFNIFICASGACLARPFGNGMLNELEHLRQGLSAMDLVVILFMNVIIVFDCPARVSGNGFEVKIVVGVFVVVVMLFFVVYFIMMFLRQASRAMDFVVILIVNNFGCESPASGSGNGFGYDFVFEYFYLTEWSVSGTHLRQWILL